MAARTMLDADDREVLALVSKAIFTNPFSDERERLNARIAGIERAGGETLGPEHFLPRVEARLDALAARGAGTIKDFGGEDRVLVEYAHLFHIYHRAAGDFDALIAAQLAEGDRPAPAPFTARVLEELRRVGFGPEEAPRFLEMFFQLRRAFFFIDRGLIGRSPSMRKLRLALWNSVFTHDLSRYVRSLWNRMEDFSTLILGETGTGKGAAAAAIGRSCYIPFNAQKGAFAESFTKTFLAINLSQYPETLIESELFGHRKGAFTGAIDNHDGAFSRGSRHGALFLDEIGEVSVPVQIKLLQVLQERTFSPVGGREKLRFEGRVIAATNTPLERLRCGGKFRDDFFYRLCSDVIVVPPLRQRIAEDPRELDALLALTVARILGEEAPEVATLVGNALDRELPRAYPWPGNVRELEQAVRRILLTGAYTGEAPAPPDAVTRIVRGIESCAFDAHALLCRYAALLYERCGSYEETARRMNLDRRTVKKYVGEAEDLGR